MHKADVDMHAAANILTSFLRCTMMDCDPDEELEEEGEEEEEEEEEEEG